MKHIVAPFFLFIFLTFIAIPSIVVLIDDRVDVSFAYTANEEENSKHDVQLLQLIDRHANSESIHFLQEQNPVIYYSASSELVYLDVLSPPPKHNI